VAESVLLVSRDPLLSMSLAALARGRLLVVRVDPSHRPWAWPAEAISTVVLDLGAKERGAACSWVRQHYQGTLVVLVRAGEQESSLPPDPNRLVLHRPLGVPDLINILTDLAATGGPAGRLSQPQTSGLASGQDPARSDLPPATTAQRRRRLGFPSIPARPTPTVAAGRLVAGHTTEAMSSPVPTDRAARPADSPKPARDRSPRPRRPSAIGWAIAQGVLLGVLVVTVVVGAWLVVGLLHAREDLRAQATAYRTELTRAEEALGSADPAAAKAAIRAATLHLNHAEAITARRPMRVAARLPVLASGVSDVRHLVAAARNLASAGDRAVAVSSHLQSGRFVALERGRFDLEALDDVIAQAKGLVDELDRVRVQLALVRGGSLAAGADQIKRWALQRLDEAAARARRVAATLQALRAALGADSARTYLVILTNPAELHPGGGAPVAVLTVRTDEGVVEVNTRDGDIAENVHNTQATWTAVTGDPWARGGKFTQFSLANSSPHFPTSGQELLRGYAAGGRSTPDGVIGIDPFVMRALLRATAPVTVPGYGKLTADNCVKRMTHDAYVRWPSREQRHGYNEALLRTLVGRLLSGPDLVTTGRILGAAGARRQLQIYAADPAVQRALVGNRMHAGLSQSEQDYLGVFTLNTNRSRMDYFQRRSIQHLVRLRPDGSAEVTRTIRIDNDVPPSEPIQSGAEDGYASGRAAAVLANYLPSGATLQGTTRDGRSARPSVVTERGRLLVRVDIDLAPRQSTSVTLRYLTSGSATAEGEFRYRLTADPQVLIRAPSLRVDVVVPPGVKISAPPGWTAEDAMFTLNRPFTDAIDTAFDVSR
jgi:Protein of unknown function (DUF4012)